MYPFASQNPDCRVFIRRLITPDPEVVRAIPLGDSQLDYIGKKGLKGNAFKNYYPKGDFAEALADKYNKKYLPIVTKYNERIATLDTEETELLKTREDILKEIEDGQGHLQPAYAAELKKQLTEVDNKLALNAAELRITKISKKTVNPLYEPYLLELAIGVYNVTTNIVRSGVGTASISIKLPLAENGFMENILYAYKVDDLFSEETASASPISVDAMRTIKSVSKRELNIFETNHYANGAITINRRKCSLLPNDMIQIYFTKRYRTGESKKLVDVPRFPKDYLPGFTGFIKDSQVSFQGGATPNFSINISCEDVASILRLSRANIDPAFDPTYRARGIDVTMAVSKLQSYGNELKPGGEIIKGLIVGRDGFWGGVSQIETQDDVQYDAETQQYASVKGRDVRVVSMPWEFDQIPLNTYDDLISEGIWSPYVSAFKSSFRLWESEYKYRWDICKEIAEVMEFELYADQFGAINYYPPMYNLNPVKPTYYIDDKDILNESHKFSDANAVTGVEVTSQPKLNAIPNTAKNLTAYATASDELTQRFGIRYRTKNIPALSGTEDNPSDNVDQTKLKDARYLFARAWLNRRNLELASGSVDLPGTPEMFVCNPVVFVGDYTTFISTLAKSLVLQSEFNPVSGTPIKLSEAATKLRSKKKFNRELVDNLMVYYISGVSHKYTQGGSYTTTLNLTHGRKWGDQYNIGYSFSSDEGEDLVKKFKREHLNRPEDDFEMLEDMLVRTKKAGLTATAESARPPLDGVRIPETKLQLTPTSILSQQNKNAKRVEAIIASASAAGSA